MTHPRFMRAKRLAPDRSGTVAVEFALLMPLMLSLFIASMAITNVVLAYMKVNAAAQTVADLIAQQQKTLADADVQDYGNAARGVMSPLPTSATVAGVTTQILKLSYASVVWVGGAPTPSTLGSDASDTANAGGSWHQEDGGAKLSNAAVIAAANSVCNATTTDSNGNALSATADCPNGQSVVIVQATYNYPMPFSFVPFKWLSSMVAGGFNLTETAITRPRYVSYVKHS
jgi:Flp pilus assembly protein TadG